MRSRLFACLLVLSACGGKSGAGDPDAGGGVDGDVDAPPVGFPDAPDPRCGDGRLDTGEVCDDSNDTGNDGCSGDCMLVEPGWACGDPGQPCVVTHVCGNGLVEDTEACDDRNVADGDGCTGACAVEPGWQCQVPGIRCTAAQCGDGIVAGFEECDDGNAATPGCSATCTLEPGYSCTMPGQACTTTTCGDGVKEGTEQCDDGSIVNNVVVPNNNLGDGCTPLCTAEPQCTNGTCTAVCGDGVLQVGEGCDDGNLKDADGCSATCAQETGFSCLPSTSQEPMTLPVPVVYRDLKGNDLAGGHVDFQNINQAQQGMVTSSLVNNKPQLIDANDYGAAHTSIKNRASFAQWYTDSTFAKSIATTLPLGRVSAGTYVYDNGAFFPVDGIGWQSATVPMAEREPSRNNNHNFSFTSELRYWFKWQGNEQLSFRGDDDVWVFVNKKLAVDLGGVHGAQDGAVTLDAATNTSKSLGMTIGGTYEVVVFQAERHTTASSYKLTLKGFNTTKSVCDDTCGDGVTSSNEACDDGINDGTYNHCTATCGFGPRCGDAMVQTPEEQCDNGTAMNTGGYGKCTPNCQLGPRCGDGIIQSPQEGCDDGNTTDGDGCPANCQSVIGKR